MNPLFECETGIDGGADSGVDYLETIALCEAVYAAAREHRVTTVREFLHPT